MIGQIALIAKLITSPCVTVVLGAFGNVRCHVTLCLLDPIPANPKEFLRLRDLIITHMLDSKAKGTRVAIRFVFDEAIRMGKNPERIVPDDIIRDKLGEKAYQALNPDQMAKADQAVRSMMSRLNRDLKSFFEEQPPCEKERQRVQFEVGDYYPRIVPNHRKTEQEDYVAAFWRPYFTSSKRTRILYTEAQSFIDSRQTYFLSNEANSPDKKNIFDYLNVPGGLDSISAFISSGTVQALLSIIECLRRYAGQREDFITAATTHPGDIVPDDDENLIILATPASAVMVSILEKGMPFRRSGKHVAIENEQPVEDDDIEMLSQDTASMVKWGVLTRRRHRFNDRIVTVLAARNGRTIEAMADCLTDKMDITALAGKFDRTNGFPASHQALFRVELTRTQRGQYIDGVRVQKAVAVETHSL